MSAAFTAGYEAGKNKGYEEGYSAGWEAGREAAAEWHEKQAAELRRYVTPKQKPLEREHTFSAAAIRKLKKP